MIAADTQARRGVGLTVLLALFAVVQLWVVYRGLSVWYRRVSHWQVGWELPLAGAILALVALVAVVAMWYWRRWGVYLLGAVAVIGVVTDVVAGIPPWSLLVRLVLLGLLAWFVRAKWAAFR